MEGQAGSQAREHKGKSSVSSLDKTREFFQACDLEGKGYVTRTDMRRLHKELPLSEEELENVFDSLDLDRNGYLTLGGFSSGFSDFLHSRKILKAEDLATNPLKSSEAVYQNQWEGVVMRSMQEEDKQFVMLLEGLGATNVFEEPGEVRSLWAQLRNDEPHLLYNFEEFLARVTFQIKEAQQEKEDMENALRRNAAVHDSEIRRLYEEMEQQIKSEKDVIILKDSERLLLKSKDLQEQLSSKEQELDQLFQKQRRLERQCQELFSERQTSRVESVKLKITNEELLRELGHTSHELNRAQEQLAVLQEEASRLQQEREMEMYRVTEGLQREKQSLMKQLDLLREMNKHLRDERDITFLKPKSTPQRSSRRPTRIPSLKRKDRNNSVKSEGATDQEAVQHVHSLSYTQATTRVLKMETSEKEAHGGGGTSSYESQTTFRPDATAAENLNTPQVGWPLRRVISIEEDHLPHLLQGEPPPLLHQLSEEEEEEVQPMKSSEEEGNAAFELSSVDSTLVVHESQSQPLVASVSPRRKGSRRAARRPGTPSSLRGQPVGKETHQQVEGTVVVPDRLFKVILVGNSCVGKTALLRRFCEDRFHRNTPATVGVDYSVRTLNLGDINVALQLWDSAGQERYRSITKQFFRRVDGVVIIYDITVEESFEAVGPWIANIHEAVGNDIPIMVLGNKMDLDNDRAVSLRQGKRLAQEGCMMFYEVSAFSGYNIMNALIHLARVLRETEDHEKEMTIQLSSVQPVKKRSCCK